MVFSIHGFAGTGRATFPTKRWLRRNGTSHVPYKKVASPVQTSRPVGLRKQSRVLAQKVYCHLSGAMRRVHCKLLVGKGSDSYEVHYVSLRSEWQNPVPGPVLWSLFAVAMPFPTLRFHSHRKNFYSILRIAGESTRLFLIPCWYGKIESCLKLCLKVTYWLFLLNPYTTPQIIAFRQFPN